MRGANGIAGFGCEEKRLHIPEWEHSRSESRTQKNRIPSEGSPSQGSPFGTCVTTHGFSPQLNTVISEWVHRRFLEVCGYIHMNKFYDRIMQFFCLLGGGRKWPMKFMISQYDSLECGTANNFWFRADLRRILSNLSGTWVWQRDVRLRLSQLWEDGLCDVPGPCQTRFESVMLKPQARYLSAIQGT